MRKILFLSFLLYCGAGISQSDIPFYEQIAFDLYQSVIIDSFPIKKKVKVYPYAIDFHPLRINFYKPTCLEIKGKINNKLEEIKSYVETQQRIDSDRFKLNFTNLNKKKFKVKKRGKGTYPRLNITVPYQEINGDKRIFVNIHESHKYKYVTYHIEFNDKGEIIDWCRTYDEICY